MLLTLGISSDVHTKLLQRVLFLSYLLSRALVQGSQAATHLFVSHVGPCARAVSPRYILNVKEMLIVTQHYDGVLSGEFNITEDVGDGWTVKATMQKCQDMRNIDTCDHFSTYRVVRAGCAEDSEEAYAQVFQHTQPQMSCPVSAGAYRLVEYPLYSANNPLSVHEARISSSLFGYLLLLEGTTVDRRKLFCVEAYLQLLNLRERNWLRKPHAHNFSAAPTAATRDAEDDDDTD